MILMELHGKEVAERIKKAVEEHEKAGGDWKTQGPIYSKVRVQLLEKYRDEHAQTGNTGRRIQRTRTKRLRTGIRNDNRRMAKTLIGNIA